MSLDQALAVLSELADSAWEDVLRVPGDRFIEGRCVAYGWAFDAVAALLPTASERISRLTPDQAAAPFAHLGQQLARDHDRHIVSESEG